MGQTISTTQFYLYGKKHFTQTGYLRHLKDYKGGAAVQDAAFVSDTSKADGVNLDGKVIVVTGANAGIGKEIATYAASKGATLYMLCRSKERAEAARTEIMKLTSNDNIKVLLADVSELKQVRKVVEELKTQESKVDCLVCNAGVLLNERATSSEGYESTFASHLLGGSYYLTQLLIPLLQQAGSEARVVFVTSGGMLNTKFPKWDIAISSPESKKAYSGNLAYAYAKRGQVLLAEQWAKEYPEIKFVSAHPGWTSTAAVELAYGDQKKYLEPMRTPWQGAEGITWLMSTPASLLKSGEFYLDRETQRKHVAGPFFSEGSFTKNTPKEVEDMMNNLQKAVDDILKEDKQ